jgi:hypothetical protein
MKTTSSLKTLTRSALAACCLAFTTAAASAVTAEPVHLWDFEGAGPFADKIGAANGTVTASTVIGLVPGHVASSTAMSAPGQVATANDFVAISGGTLYNPTMTGFSVSLWFQLPNDGGAFPRGIFDFSGNSGDTGPQSLYTQTGNLAFRVDGTGTAFSLANVAAPALEDGAWHFLAAIYEPGAQLKVYLDSATPSTTVAAMAAGMNIAANANSWLGTFNYSGVSARNGLAGNLDDFGFYSGLLTEAQVAGLLNGTLTPSQVPEPAAAALAAFGLAALLALRRPTAEL